MVRGRSAVIGQPSHLEEPMDSGQHGGISDPFMGWPIEIHTVFRLRDSLGRKRPGNTC